MTSSFGTIVGKERDVIPDLSATNYGATEPDLTDSVNAQIDANIQDTQNFYNEMAEIQKLIAETPMRNLESLAQFSQSASQAMKALKARKEAQDKIKEAMSFMDNNLLEELRDADGKFNLQDAKVNNQLFKENTKESINFLHTRTTVEPEDISIKELLRRQKESYFGARQQIVNERGGKKLTDIDEYMKLHGAADELMITAMLMEAEKLGIDTNSRKFRRLFYEKMWPDIQQRKENNIQTWKAESNRNYERNRNDKLDKIIVDTLQPYNANSNTPVDVVTLVDTIQNTMNFDTTKEATDYLFERVAAEVQSDQPQLDLQHLNYLFNDALHRHDGNGGKLYTYADGPFGGKDANASLIQRIETILSNKLTQNINANTNTAQRELNELNQKHKGEIPPLILQNKYEELENRYPHLDVRSLQVGSQGVTTGGEYQDKAGVADFEINYVEKFKSVINKDPQYVFDDDEKFALKKAYGDFKFLVERQVENGIERDQAQKLMFTTVKENLEAGLYNPSEVEKRRGKQVRTEDIIRDGEYLKSDITKVPNQGEYVSVFEKQALGNLKRHYEDPLNVPFPQYWIGVTRNTDLNPYSYARDRFAATDGYDEKGNIAQRFVQNDDGVLIDPQYGLTQNDLNEIEVKPHLTKLYSKILDPKIGEKILKVFKTGNDIGSFDSAVGPKKRGADKLTIGELLVYADRGGSNFGIFGLSGQDLKDSVRFLPPSFKNRVFDEKTQSFLMLELVRQRANRTNSIQGAIIQAKKGGKETVFQGDEKEGSWNKLVQLADDEIEAILDVFPQLRNIPMNQFQNLSEGVVLGLQTEINNYNRNREKQRNLRKQKNKKEGPTTMEELLEVPAVKQARSKN